MTIQQGQIEELGLTETYVTPQGNIRVLDSLRITPSWGAIWYTDLDLGFPTIKEASFDYPDDDGAFDTTKRHGGRAVSLTMTVLDNAYPDLTIPGTSYLAKPEWNSASELVTMLSGWMSPWRRPYLYYRLRGQVGHKRWIDLRSAGATRALSRDTRTSQTVQLNWVSPSGKIRSFNETADGTPDGRTRVPLGQASVGLTGRAYNEVYPKNYAVATVANTVIPYRGTVQTGFLLRVTATASASNPLINFIAPDNRVSSIGLTYTMAAGEVVEFDTTTKTVTQGIYSTTSVPIRLNQYIAQNSTWPQLQPGFLNSDIGSGNAYGTNRVQVLTTSGSVTAEVLFYDSFLM